LGMIVAGGGCNEPDRHVEIVGDEGERA